MEGAFFLFVMATLVCCLVSEYVKDVNRVGDVSGGKPHNNKENRCLLNNA